MKRSNGKLTPFGKLVVILYGVRSGEKYLPAIVAALSLDPRKVEKAIAA